METVNTRSVSVLDPVGRAINKTKQILFDPFNLEKWFVIGFCAWLAGLGGGGGGGGGFNMGSSNSHCPPNVHHIKQEVSAFISQSLPWLLPVAAAGILLIIAIGLLVVWLKSRGQFMFLDCIIKNRAAVSAPWTEYRAEGNSLFGFKFILWLVGFLLMLGAIIPLIIIFVMFARNDFAVIRIVPAFAAGLLLFVFVLTGLALGVVKVLTDDFVVPVMYRRRCGVKAAWKECMGLFSARPGMFVLYLLFLIVIGVVMGFLAAICALMACCCFCCVSWTFCIPFIGSYLMTVLLLPLAVWRRSYAILFLSQFGPEFDVFETVVSPAEPVSAEVQIVPLPPEQNPQTPPSEGHNI